MLFLYSSSRGFFVPKFALQIKGINTAGQAGHPNGVPMHPPPTAASAASRGVLNHRLSKPPVPHSLNHARASTAAISLRSSIKCDAFYSFTVPTLTGVAAASPSNRQLPAAFCLPFLIIESMLS
jgi:hypothetical protein